MLVLRVSCNCRVVQSHIVARPSEKLSRFHRRRVPPETVCLNFLKPTGHVMHQLV